MRATFTYLIIGLLLACNSFAQTPIHEFSFDNTLSNTANTVTLVSSQSLNGTTLGFTANRYGDANKAFINTNTGSQLTATISNLPIGTASRSIEFWVKFLNGYSGDHYLVGYGTNTTNQAYGITQNTSSVISYGWANDVTTTLTYTTNVWYHYVITYDGITAAIYRNGVLVGNAGKSWNTVGQLFRIGATPANNVGLSAAIDDLKIYNTALTHTQVLSIYNNTPLTGSPGAPINGLLGYYSFETNYNSNNGNHNFGMDAASALNSVSAGISSGKYGKCLDVGFGNGAISNTSLSAALNNKFFSVACWVNKTNGTNNYSSAFELFASAFYRYNFAIPTVQEFAMAVSSSSYQSATSTLLPSNTWVHIALVFDREAVTNIYKLKLYQNGILVATKDMGTTASFYQFNTKAVIGGGTNADGSLNVSKCFKGLIDEVYIYDRAITESELLNIMNNTNGTLLPSKLTNFTGKLQGQTAQLNWNTSSETNTSHFELEYGNNGKDFSTVKTITASGNSSNYKNYAASHTIGNAVNHYYRLKMVDKDGSYSYSNIVKLKSNSKDFEASIYPTVAVNAVTVSISSIEKADGLITISSMEGKIVLQKKVAITAGNQTCPLDISSLQSGSYIINLSANNHKQVCNIIKQ